MLTLTPSRWGEEGDFWIFFFTDSFGGFWLKAKDPSQFLCKHCKRLIFLKLTFHKLGHALQLFFFYRQKWGCYATPRFASRHFFCITKLTTTLTSNKSWQVVSLVIQKKENHYLPKVKNDPFTTLITNFKVTGVFWLGSESAEAIHKKKSKNPPPPPQWEGVKVNTFGKT